MLFFVFVFRFYAVKKILKWIFYNDAFGQMSFTTN